MHAHVLALSVLAATALTAEVAAAEPADTQEPALAIAFDDPSLTWGPCPEFLPEGCAIAVLHGDPAGGNAEVFFRVPGGSTLPLHWHTSAERMVLISGRLQVSYEGQAPVLLQPGMYAYGPPRRPHSGRCEGSESCVLFIAFESPVDAMPIEAAATRLEGTGRATNLAR